MALKADDLTQIDQILSAVDADAGVFADLRKRFPHLSWTRCDASDVTETPFRIYPKFEVHLLDAADHCVLITTDPERATGIVLAARKTMP
ncbi:MAG: hypothetical protein B7Y12_21155 [Rhizobiales bacterium 24-66-13]|uniref:hypothetical protein n=1 Tax=Roseixanthobacter finlandensis TaxID=3119922 RepID=UPI000BD2EADC|nr:MAG: hypothetical protein B7Y61_19580 [Rhizobiales bacterium 35-66-30]OYZ67902.1 MAG: hypothetical protein B7Y12_21155 [Rhizobiales bacterium 24-66-13]OZA95710.1 MAG: hypothetical protein B7X67_25175 [Rhizobiales bacterium 39-66-18]